MAKYLEKMYSGQEEAAKKTEEKTKESLWKRGKTVAKDFWEGKNGFGSKIGNRATAIGVPALAATAGTVYALRKKAAKAAAAADELEAAATEQNFSEHIYNDAFEAGYMYAQREFAKKADNAELIERLNRDEYEREMAKRKKKRTGGHVMGALGTVGVINHAGGEYLNRTAPEVISAPEELKKAMAAGKWVNRGLGLGAAALTAGGLYRINKKANKNMTYEDWLAEKDSQNED